VHVHADPLSWKIGWHERHRVPRPRARRSSRLLVKASNLSGHHGHSSKRSRSRLDPRFHFVVLDFDRNTDGFQLTHHLGAQVLELAIGGTGSSPPCTAVLLEVRLPSISRRGPIPHAFNRVGK